MKEVSSHDSAAIVILGVFGLFLGVLIVAILINHVFFFFESDGPEAAETFHGGVGVLVDSFLTEHALGLSFEPSSLFVHRRGQVFFIVLVSESDVD